MFPKAQPPRGACSEDPYGGVPPAGGQVWERYEGDLDLPSVRPALRALERLYNTFLPHQALARLTPAEYLIQRHPELAPTSPVSYAPNEYRALTQAQEGL